MFRFIRSDGRFYNITIQYDLFGDTVIFANYGNIGSRRGGIKSYPVNDSNLFKTLKTIVNRRLKNGYILQLNWDNNYNAKS